MLFHATPVRSHIVKYHVSRKIKIRQGLCYDKNHAFILFKTSTFFDMTVCVPNGWTTKKFLLVIFPQHSDRQITRWENTWTLILSLPCPSQPSLTEQALLSRVVVFQVTFAFMRPVFRITCSSMSSLIPVAFDMPLYRVSVGAEQIHGTEKYRVLNLLRQKVQSEFTLI